MKAEIKFLQLDYYVESTTNPKEDALGYLYIHKRLDTNTPFYIGTSCDKNFFRAKDKRGRNIIWKRISKKYGYKIEILFQNIPADILLQKEIEFIKIYGRVDKNTGILSNMSDGGETRNDFSPNEQIRHKLRIAHTKNRILHFDRNDNLLYCWNNAQSTEEFGYSATTVIACCKGKRLIHADSKWSYYDNRDISFIKKLSPPTNNSSVKKPIVQLDLNDKIVQYYDYISQVVAIGFSSSSISAILSNINKTSCGYKFQLYNKNLHDISHVDRNQIYQPIIKSSCDRKVVQLDINKNILKVYKSLADAIASGYISSVINKYINQDKSFKNYYWQYYDPNIHTYCKLPEVEIKVDDKKIVQIGRDGFIVNIFNNIEHLFNLGYNISNIKNTIKKHKKYLNTEYTWKYYENSDDLSKCEYKYFRFIALNKQPIVQFDMDNRYIKLYEGSLQINRNKFTTICVSNCCTGKSSHHNNHKFMFLKDYIKDNPNFIPTEPNDVNIYDNFIFNEEHKIIGT